MKGRAEVTKKEFLACAARIFREIDQNTVHLPEEDVDIPVLMPPVIGIAGAEDPLYEEFLKAEVIGPEFKKPGFWLEGAQSVAAFFFPFSEEIKVRRRASKEPNDESWAYGYVKKDEIVNTFLDRLIAAIREMGFDALDPVRDPRMERRVETVNIGGTEDMHVSIAWSTRHICYVAGLGTFGIHRHIITEKGCMGTLGTLVMTLPLPADRRPYTGVYEYCSNCGACIDACPAGAITKENYRNLIQCSSFAASLKEIYGSGYCGRCMVGVPCESRNPKAFPKSILIKDTTREQRMMIVKKSLEVCGQECEFCNGCDNLGGGRTETYFQPYIDGLKELREINAEYHGGTVV